MNSAKLRQVSQHMLADQLVERFKAEVTTVDLL